MSPSRPEGTLSPPTSWSLLADAHDPGAPAELRESARRRLVERYQALARRYLEGALHHEPGWQDAADECLQEFAIHALRGAYKGASPERGRFRHYLRACLSNLVTDYRLRKQRERGLGELELAAAEAAPVSEQEFLSLWREELVASALRALAEHERQTGQRLYTVLRLKMDHPEKHSGELAEMLAGTGERPLTEAGVRKRLSRAREKLTELLRAEVRRSVGEVSEEEVDEELAEVGLLEYCRRPGAGA